MNAPKMTTDNLLYNAGWNGHGRSTKGELQSQFNEKGYVLFDAALEFLLTYGGAVLCDGFVRLNHAGANTAPEQIEFLRLRVGAKVAPLGDIQDGDMML